MKRILYLLLALVTVFSLTAGAFASGEPQADAGRTAQENAAEMTAAEEEAAGPETSAAEASGEAEAAASPTEEADAESAYAEPAAEAALGAEMPVTDGAAVYDFNADNCDRSFTALDGQTVSTRADGKAKVILFTSTGCLNCSMMIAQIVQALNDGSIDAGCVDILAANCTGETYEQVSTAYAAYTDSPITFCYNAWQAASYYLRVLGLTTYTTPVVVYLGADNRVVRVTSGFDNTVCNRIQALAGSKVTASGSCGDNLTWNLDKDGVLTVSGTGEMYDMYDVTPWYNYSGGITTLVVENGVTTIGDFAFGFCTSLTAVSLPESLTEIGLGAFYYCSELPGIDIPDGVESIARSAFEGCSALTRVSIPDSLTTIGDYAFSGCGSLPSLTAPAGVTSIGECVFEYCTALTDLYICNPDCMLSEYLCSAFTAETDEKTGELISVEYVPSAEPTIHGYAGSTAQTFAEQNGLTFAALNTPNGDLSGDGKVNIIDALNLFRAVNGQIDAPGASIADLNGDGRVNIIDALRLFRFVNGQIDTLKASQ